MNTETEEEQSRRSPPARPRLLAVHPVTAALPLTGTLGRTWAAQHGHLDHAISEEHAVVHRQGAPGLEDRSKNGTWVNGRRLGRGVRTTVPEGAVLRMSRLVGIVRWEHLDPDEPDPPLEGLVAPWGLRQLRRDIATLVPGGHRKNVLVTGPPGTGKELVARAVARHLRPNKPFVACNVAALGSLLEAELFGHSGHAFTGAGGKPAPGRIRSASGGVIFLDELHGVPIDRQPALLRFLESREVQPLGGRVEVVDVDVVAATNEPLHEAARFRGDLRDRFRFVLEVPLLADRPEDIVAIAATLVKRDNVPLDVAAFPPALVERMLLHSWPGNVRELEAFLHELHGVGLDGWQLAADRRLPERRKGLPSREELEEAMARSGSERAAAESLGVSRGMLRRLLAGHRHEDRGTPGPSDARDTGCGDP